MKHRLSQELLLWAGVAVCAAFGGGVGLGADTNTQEQLDWLRQQNSMLQGQVQRQQQVIDSLSRDVAEIRQAGARGTNVYGAAGSEAEQADEGKDGTHFTLGKVRITGEGGVAFFETGSEGMFPNSEFRVDEARLFVDAPVWGSVYAFAQVDLVTREASSSTVQLGELYLDAEDLSELWGQDRQLNLRAGQFYIPFGEEYQRRFAIDNPLITHSLSDLWGLDEGVELYGALGKFSYATAVQNGGVSALRDFSGDKSVSGRVSWDPSQHWHFSVSGMRTGDLDVQQDRLSAMWFGNGFFRSLGSPGTTLFHANLVEGDIDFRGGPITARAFGGWVGYADNDPAGYNTRDVYYYCLEVIGNITRGFYCATRFSQILAHGGFPIVGNASRQEYLFGPLTDNLWRLSLGAGYRWSQNLVLKAEYAFEQGTEAGGDPRNHENLFATEAAFGF